LALVNGYSGSLERATHGLSERTAAGGRAIRDSEIEVGVTSAARPSIFRLLATSADLPAPAAGQLFPVEDLLPQVVVGHRLYRASTRTAEKFITVDKVRLMKSAVGNSLWVELVFDRGRLSRYGVSGTQLLADGDLDTTFREVASGVTGTRRFEMLTAVAYGARPTDGMYRAVRTVRPKLWRALSGVRPYRTYYVCLATANRLPQILASYMLMFYFGSVTRYRPHIFDRVLAGPLGGFVTEFITSEPEQLLYGLASQLAQREVVRAL